MWMKWMEWVSVRTWNSCHLFTLSWEIIKYGIKYNSHGVLCGNTVKVIKKQNSGDLGDRNLVIQSLTFLWEIHRIHLRTNTSKTKQCKSPVLFLSVYFFKTLTEKSKRASKYSWKQPRCPSKRQMDKETVVHIPHGMLLSH